MSGPRDAAVVWHGFTQMDAFVENAPILVERGEGHELIDVDGRRYFDAISSLWVNTLGHHVPELDDAVRAQLERGAHSTMLGNGNVVVVELAEALARVVPVDDPHFLFASDGASAVEQALKIAFQYWANRDVTGHTTFLAFGGAYHGDTIGALSLGDGGFGTDLFDPLRFPVLRAPHFGDPACFDTAVAMIAAHADELAAVVVEPLVQGAAGMQLADPDGLRALGAACRAHDVLLLCDEVATGFGRTGTLFASEQCGLRPDLLVLGKGLTAGYLPMSATVASGRVFDAFLGPDLSDAHALPRALLLRERARGGGGAPSPRAARRVVGARQRAHAVRRTAGAARRPGRSPSGGARGPALRSDGRRRARGRRSLRAVGPAGLRGRGRSRRAAPPPGRRRRADAAAHRDLGGAAPHGARAHRRAR